MTLNTNGRYLFETKGGNLDPLAAARPTEACARRPIGQPPWRRHARGKRRQGTRAIVAGLPPGVRWRRVAGREAPLDPLLFVRADWPPIRRTAWGRTKRCAKALSLAGERASHPARSTTPGRWPTKVKLASYGADLLNVGRSTLYGALQRLTECARNLAAINAIHKAK
jgi:hypothetical protein